MVLLHVYAAAYELQGPSEDIDEDELNRDPDGVAERLKDNFIDWLKGKPELMRDNGGLEIEKGAGSAFAGTPEHVLNLAQQRRARKKFGLVEKTRGFRVSVSRRGQVLIQDIKSGRFSSRARFLES